MAQVPPAATAAQVLLATLYSAALAPAIVGAPTVMAAALELVTVTVWAALVAPTAVDGKVRPVGPALSPGASWPLTTNRFVWTQLGPVRGAGQSLAGLAGVGRIPGPSTRKTLFPVGLPMTPCGVTPSEMKPAGGAGSVASKVRKGS